ncbi:hypothetical protein ACWIUD_08640 [Helicobacter sp. 23-1044]
MKYMEASRFCEILRFYEILRNTLKSQNLKSPFRFCDFAESICKNEIFALEFALLFLES